MVSQPCCQLTSLESIRQSVDKGSVVGAVFLDLKKAFDTTNHNIFYLPIKLRPGTDLQIYADTVVHVSGKKPVTLLRVSAWLDATKHEEN